MCKICIAKKYKPPGLSALSPKGVQWKIGETIQYAFLKGTKKERAIVESVLREVEQMCHLKFELSKLQDSDIRISFIKNGGSWSYLGTDCLFVPKDEPTMNFGWSITKDLGTVRHEVGHAIGLGHEHSNPDDPVQWNREIVLKDMKAQGWRDEEIESNVFKLYEFESLYSHSRRDKGSVMHYFFPAKWTNNSEYNEPNENWSRSDIEFLQHLYPKPSEIETNVRYKKALQSLYKSRVIHALWKIDHVAVAEVLGVDTQGNEMKVINRIKSEILD